MADDNDRLYYYDGEWRTYDYLHENYGMTLNPSTPVVRYDSSLNEYSGWIDTSDNTTWIVQDSQWYTDNDIPYWTKLQKVNIYLIDQNLNLNEYSLRESITYPHNGQLQSFQYMHLGFGITRTPSEIYYIKDGIIKCWYNKDIDKYWDVDTVQWYDNPPDYDSGSGGGSGGSGSCDCNCDCNGIIPGSGDVNSVGAIGLFSYYSETGSPTKYGTLVDGSRLLPVCITFPDSGDISYTKHTIKLTGTWKLLTETSNSSQTKPCIVVATKISEQASENDSESTDINSVGATGLFSYYSDTGGPTKHGTLINGNRLYPVCISFSDSGDVVCTKYSTTLTGTWRLLTETQISSPVKPCIVFATKISEQAPENTEDNIANSTVVSINPISSIEHFDL